MPNLTSKTHERTRRVVAPQESGTGDARRQALDWIARELRWERTLDALRAQSRRP